MSIKHKTAGSVITKEDWEIIADAQSKGCTIQVSVVAHAGTESPVYSCYAFNKLIDWLNEREVPHL